MREALERSTIYFPPDGDNLRFFEIPPSPGDRLIVLDFFTPSKRPGPRRWSSEATIEGSIRAGPSAEDLPLNKSRVPVGGPTTTGLLLHFSVRLGTDT